MKAESTMQRILPCFINWELWKARNSVTLDNVNPSLPKIIAQIYWWSKCVSSHGSGAHSSPTSPGIQAPSYNQDPSNANGRPQPPNVAHLQSNRPARSPLSYAGVEVVRWSQPRAGWVKINVDGSALGNPRLSGGAGVCRGERGNFIFAFVAGYDHGSNVHVELRAFHDGLLLCLSTGLRKIIVESDSRLIINFIFEKASLGWKWRAWLCRINALIPGAHVE
ncbi:uncharacterized protein LOC131254888 [Magnolia sinica]|uniref:uncharacterized protein LOC131254888 n=1 Tax=Magnolia sinica TaxID=86752 RepID=UPI002659514A|nr:uncharacterized protein LOC131254888 [Magnolia sinica]